MNVAISDPLIWLAFAITVRAKGWTTVESAAEADRFLVEFKKRFGEGNSSPSPR